MTPVVPRSVKNTSVAKRLAGGAVVSLAVSLVGAVLGLVEASLLTRVLSPDVVGSWFLTQSTVMAAAIVARLGLPTAAVRMIAGSLVEQPGKARRAIRQSVGFAAVAAVVCGVAYACGIGEFLGARLFGSVGVASVGKLGGLWLAVFAMMGLLAELLRAVGRIGLAVWFRSPSHVFGMCVGLAVLWWLEIPAGTKTIVGVAIVASSASVLTAGLLMWRQYARMGHKDDRAALGILAVSLPIMGSTLLAFMFNQGSVWVLGGLAGDSEVAKYGAAFRLAAVVALPHAIAHAASPPIIAELWSAGAHAQLERSIRILATLALLPALPMATVFVLFGGTVLELVFGSEYADAAPVLALLALGQLAGVMSGACGLMLMMTSHQKTQFGVLALGGTLGLSLSLTLVPQHGALGAAIGMTVGLSLQYLGMAIASRVATGIWVHAHLPTRRVLCQLVHMRHAVLQLISRRGR